MKILIELLLPSRQGEFHRSGYFSAIGHLFEDGTWIFWPGISFETGCNRILIILILISAKFFILSLSTDQVTIFSLIGDGIVLSCVFETSGTYHSWVRWVRLTPFFFKQSTLFLLKIRFLYWPALYLWDMFNDPTEIFLIKRSYFVSIG